MSCQVNANNDNIIELMEITGLPREEAGRLLEISDFNLGLAVTYYLESTEEKSSRFNERNNLYGQRESPKSYRNLDDDDGDDGGHEKDEHYSDDSVGNLHNKKRTESVKKRKRKNSSTSTTSSTNSKKRSIIGAGIGAATAAATANQTNFSEPFSYRKRRSNNNSNKSSIVNSVNEQSSAQTAINNGNSKNSVPSTSSQAIKSRLDEIDPEENVRAPIPPKREQLIKPEEDIFRDIVGSYGRNAFGNSRTLTRGGSGINSNTNSNNRKRRQPTFSVCPLRNFAREAEIQEQQLSWLMENNDNMNANDGSNIINNRRNLSATNTGGSAGGGSSSGNLSSDIIYNSRSNRNTAIRGSNNNRPVARRSRLEDLFAPPIDILFWGTFHAARDHATNLNRWLIVNLQNNSEFKSQILNRDIWPDPALKQLIIRHFVLWQVSVDNKEGYRFKTFYHVKDFPYVCIIDPRTGEHKISFDIVTPQMFQAELLQFLKENSFTLEERNEDDDFNDTTEVAAAVAETTIPSVFPTSSSSITDHKNNSTLVAAAATQRSNIINSNNNNSHYSSRVGIPSTSRGSSSNLFRKEENDNDDDCNEDDDEDYDDNDDDDGIAVKKTDLGNRGSKFQMIELSEEEQLRLAIQNSLRETTIKSEQHHKHDDNVDKDFMRSSNYSKSNQNNNNNSSNKAYCKNNNIKTKLENIQMRKQDDSPSFSSNQEKNENKGEMEKEKYLNQNEDTLTKIQLRLPINGGEKVFLEWPKSTKLKIIRSHVTSHYKDITKGPYKILTTFPRQNILDLDQNITLEEAKLHPSAILHIQPEN